MQTLCQALAEGQTFASGQRFALSWLKRVPNPTSDEIVKMVARYDQAWGTELDAFLAEDERAARINALLGIRNDIAHGRNQGVGRVRANEYLGLVNEVVDWLQERFDPLPTVV